MREISRQRWLVENEGREHAVVRGFGGWFHFENMKHVQAAVRWGVRVLGLERLGRQNALDFELVEVEVGVDSLPSQFDGVRVGFMSDPHIDCIDGLADKVIGAVGKVECDYFVLGGDYSFGHGEDCDKAYEDMGRIAGLLAGRGRVFAVLGNHDRYRMGEVLDSCGVEVLINDNVKIERGGESIYIAGVDDCHYYGAQDFELAGEGIEDGAFKVMVCHSPEMYRDAAMAGYGLFLCGHTHGGQVCLPGGAIVVRGASAPRHLLKGQWRHDGMAGYTSSGVGVSGIPVRFNSRGQIAVITLKSRG